MSLTGAAAATALATGAQAETAKPRFEVSVRNESTALAPGAKSVNLDTRKGRWGVSLNLDQAETRDVQLNDVQAGAYFRITPSLRVGGAVALGDKEQPQYRRSEPVPGQPRVRLETAFKF